jgi:hypothetical protein
VKIEKVGEGYFNNGGVVLNNQRSKNVADTTSGKTALMQDKSSMRWADAG